MIAGMFLLYEALLFMAFLASLPYFLITGLMRGKYLTNLPERLGFFRSPPQAHELWVHAVSVGEVMAARPVVAEVLRQRPQTSLLITTTTITGQAQARRAFPQAGASYFPFDFRFSVERFLRHHDPRVFVTMETEIWPNAARISRQRGLRLLLANGRISDRSFPRYRAARMFLAPVLRSYERILVREKTDAERFLAIGADPAAVEVTGNVKFDYEPEAAPPELTNRLEQLIAGRPVLILGSTGEGEDELLLPLVERFVREREAMVILAPRKGERFDLVAALLATTSLRFVRRSELDGYHPGDALPDVLLLDSFGELARIYRFGTAVFIGGTLLGEVGGHNPIEAAAAGVPVCFGPSMSNFREIARAFLEAGAAEEVRTPEEVMAFAERMVEDEALRRERGERARRTVSQNRGASARTARRIIELLA